MLPLTSAETMSTGSGNTIVGVNGGHVIEDDGTPVTTRSNLNFADPLQASDGGAGPDRIDVTVA